MQGRGRRESETGVREREHRAHLEVYVDLFAGLPIALSKHYSQQSCLLYCI
jgi:hypothetical protein